MNRLTRPKVTVYITSLNYGRFLAEAVQSVLAQTLESWELLLVDDGSTDETGQIAAHYAGSDDRIRAIRHETSQGLRSCANEVLTQARGDYIIRLDGDDYFDENALLVLASYLDMHPNVALVYPNWTYIDEDGTFLGIEKRKKIGVEAKVLDLPPHGAGTMVRRRVLKLIGGYDVQFDSQDGHELWLKVVNRFDVANVSTPLFFYRQHAASLSRDEQRLRNAHQQIKRRLNDGLSGSVRPRVVGIVPAKNTYAALPNIVLKELAGKPLIDYTLDAAAESGLFDEILVFTDDPAVVAYCDGKERVLSALRPPELSDDRARLSQVLMNAVDYLEGTLDLYPDVVVLMSVHCPFRRADHIQQAVDTLFLHDLDNVISTYEDIELHFAHGSYGLKPLNPSVLTKLRYEREALYVDNGALHVIWREFINKDSLYEGRLGHIVMGYDESLQIKRWADRVQAETLLRTSSSRADRVTSR